MSLSDMSFIWMRRIDLWIGIPLLKLLSWFTPKAKSLYGDMRLPHHPRRVICTKFIGLGSVVLSLPLLKTLKESGVRVAFWSFPGQADLVKISGFADEVWVIEPTLKRFLITLWKSWRQSVRFKADAFLDLEPTANFTTLLARLSGTQMRIGFIAAKPWREQLYTHLVSLTPEHHMTENNLRMAHYLGFELPKKISPLPPIPKFPSYLTHPLPRQKKSTHLSKRVVININSSDLSWHRMWRESHWVELCKHLLEDPEIELVFPGVKSELPRVQSLMKKLNEPSRVFNLAGKSTLLQLLKLLQDSDLVISVDSGIMHLAAWAEVPLVGLFGPETPSLYAPRSAQSKVVWAKLPCSPCLSVAADKITRCKDNQCMQKITPNQVLWACESYLKPSREKIAA